MEKLFENVTRLTTRNEYDSVRAHIELLIKEATEGGHFSNPEGDNDYIREFGRLASLSVSYEDEFMDFGFRTPPKTKTIPTRKKTRRFSNTAKELLSV